MLRGAIQQRYVRCGKLGCACMRDPARRHGPYYYLMWRQGGKLRRKYVRKPDVALVRAGAAERQQLARDVRELRKDVDQLCHAFTSLVAQYQPPTRAPRTRPTTAVGRDREGPPTLLPVSVQEGWASRLATRSPGRPATQQAGHAPAPPGVMAKLSALLRSWTPDSADLAP